MTIANGLFKQTTIGKQTALGTPKTGAGGQILRRKTSVFEASRATTSNDEIVSHLQDTGITYSTKSVSGSISGNLSPSTYELLMAGIIRQDFAATADLTSLSITVGGSAGAWTLTRAAGDFLTDGIKAGDVVRLTAGSFTAGNDNNNFLVVSLTATVITGVMLNGDDMTTEGPIASATLSVMGKKAYAPTSSHTNDYFTVEEWYADLTRSEVFPDCKVNTMNISIPATGPSTIDFDIVGVGTRTIAGSQSFTTPTAETTTDVVQGVSGLAYVNGVVVSTITSASLTFDSGISPMGATLGSVVAADLNQGRLRVSGSFTAQFDSITLQTLFDDETPVSAVFVAAENNAATADFVSIALGRIKITSDAPDDGEKEVIRTYAFTAELNGAGGAALAWDNTIATIQDSAL